MSKANESLTTSSQAPPKLEQIQQTREGPGKAAPPPEERPKPGRKPLFRN